MTLALDSDRTSTRLTRTIWWTALFNGLLVFCTGYVAQLIKIDGLVRLGVRKAKRV